METITENPTKYSAEIKNHGESSPEGHISSTTAPMAQGARQVREEKKKRKVQSTRKSAGSQSLLETAA